MAKRGSNGRYILSAGEVSAYIVCPESWRLKVVERTAAAQSRRSELGRELHQDWATTIDESAFLLKGTKVIMAMVVIAIGIFILTSVL